MILSEKKVLHVLQLKKTFYVSSWMDKKNNILPFLPLWMKEKNFMQEKKLSLPVFTKKRKKLLTKI